MRNTFLVMICVASLILLIYTILLVIIYFELIDFIYIITLPKLCLLFIKSYHLLSIDYINESKDVKKEKLVFSTQKWRELHFKMRDTIRMRSLLMKVILMGKRQKSMNCID